ncbi:MAG: hypothetical protein IJ725_04935, partial [Ruminococcus sp.]|nr:hypothetical protein [Ruminococcus sp.]
MKTTLKKYKFLIMLLVALVAAVASSAVIAVATSYHTVRINYVYKDGTPAHDPYVATYLTGDDVSLTVTNPNIDGFVPMVLNEGEDDPSLLPDNGKEEAKSTFDISGIDENVNVTVYYVAGLTPYRVMYYKQNIYDDLYTRDNTVDSAHTERYGRTGSNPTVLETENLFEGFTNLFHEPDAIAADGSTVFRVYYDRNFYTVNFDLGDGGYGVEPVYAKYQSIYHIGEPQRLGYTFLGWIQTVSSDPENHPEKADSSKGTYGEDWYYMDSSGNVFKDENGNPTVDINGEAVEGYSTDVTLLNFSDGYVPAENTYYRATWKKGTTSYSIVYWIQNANDDDYSVIAAKDISNVESGTEVSYNDIVNNYDFFSFNLSKEFPTMSEDQITELNGMGRYFEFNAGKTQTYESQFTDG